MRISQYKLSIVLALACGAGCLLVLPVAQAEMLQATLVEDVFVQSNDPATNKNGSSDQIWIRNNASVSRLALFQFTLPQLPTGLTASDVIGAELVGSAQRARSSKSLIVSGLSVNPNLDAITYNDAVSQNIIIDRDASSNFNYGTSATVFSDIWSVDNTSNTNLLIPGLEQTYEDTTVDEGLLKFIQDNISATQPVTITIAVGPNGSQDSTDFRFYSQEYVPADGNPAESPMALTLTTVPEPSSAILAALGMLLGLVAIARRQR